MDPPEFDRKRIWQVSSPPHPMTSRRPRPVPPDVLSLDYERLKRALEADDGADGGKALEAMVRRVIRLRCQSLSREASEEFESLPPIAIRALARDIDWIECEADLEEWMRD
jgi:hypothetical protein